MLSELDRFGDLHLRPKNPARCQALKGNGEKCKNAPYKGSKYCYLHSVGHARGLTFWVHPLVHIVLTILAGILTGLYFFWAGPSKAVVEQTARDVSDLKQRMEQMDKKSSRQWLQKYTYGYALFGIKDAQIVLHKENRLNYQYSLDWNNAQILEITAKRVRVKLPDITDNASHSVMAGNIARIDRTVVVNPLSMHAAFIGLNELNIDLEVIEDTGSDITVLLGLYPTKGN